MIFSSKPNPLLLSIGVTLALLGVLSAIFYWYLIVVIIFIIVAVRFGFYRGYVLPKITKIDRAKVLQVPVDENNSFYPVPLEVSEENKQPPPAYYRVNWLFNIFYFIRGKKRWQVRAILPEMQEYELNLAECFYNLQEVKIIESGDKDRNYKINTFLASPIKNIFKRIKPKLKILKEKNEELAKELEVLVLSPQIYQKKIKTYSQLNKKNSELIETGESVRERGLDLIKDVLIGTDLGQSEPANIPEVADKKKQFERQCKIFLEKYQNLKQQIDNNLN